MFTKTSWSNLSASTSWVEAAKSTAQQRYSPPPWSLAHERRGVVLCSPDPGGKPLQPDTRRPRQEIGKLCYPVTVGLEAAANCLDLVGQQQAG